MSYKKLILLAILLSNTVFAEKFVSHFASIKSSEVNVRRGPNVRYSIDWVFVKKGEPVEVIAEFEHWYRVRDVSGDEGWVRSAMLSKKRTGVIVASEEKEKKNTKFFANLHRKPIDSSNLVARIEASKRIAIEQCQKEWCKIKVNNITGWIEKKYLWGVAANEVF